MLLDGGVEAAVLGLGRRSGCRRMCNKEKGAVAISRSRRSVAHAVLSGVWAA